MRSSLKQFLILISVLLYYISLTSKSLFIHINKKPKLKKYNIAAQKSNCNQGEIIGHSLCGTQWFRPVWLANLACFFWQKTSDGAYFLLVRAIRGKKQQLFWIRKYPNKIIGGIKVVLLYWNIAKSIFSSKIILKISNNICGIQKVSNIYSFHFIVLPLSVSEQFSLSMYPFPKKSMRGRKFSPPYWVVWIHTGLAK